MANRELAGRRALVTGSTGGLGLAVAEALAEAGAAVILHGLLPPDEGETLAADLAQRTSGKVRYVKADLSRPEDIGRLLSACEQQIGAVDILVNNAVVRHFSPVQDFPAERWDEALAVNLSAPFHAIRLALPAMQSAGWGRIINMASVYSTGAAENRVDYVTTKTALLGLTRTVALENATRGITCNAVAPGTLPTPAIKDRLAGMAEAEGKPLDDVTGRYLAARQPTGRFVSMRGTAALIRFLCSDAGADITGALLPVDGGWTAK